MGMIDSFHVRKENKVGIPVSDAQGYECKDLGCTLAHYVISENGFISLEDRGSNYNGMRLFEHLVMDRRLSFRNLNIYTYDKDSGGLNHLFLTVVENRIVRVADPDKVLYSNPDYMFNIGLSDEVTLVGKICSTVGDSSEIPESVIELYKFRK